MGQVRCIRAGSIHPHLTSSKSINPHLTCACIRYAAGCHMCIRDCMHAAVQKCMKSGRQRHACAYISEYGGASAMNEWVPGDGAKLGGGMGGMMESPVSGPKPLLLPPTPG
jgi:hypothetical protein